MRLRAFTLLCLVMLFGCDNPERNVILYRTPFYHVELPFVESRTDAIVETVRRYSKQNHMDFLLARATLAPGDFNASANAFSINLAVIRVGAMRRGVEIDAISRQEPTPQDFAIALQFTNEVKAAYKN